MDTANVAFRSFSEIEKLQLSYKIAFPLLLLKKEHMKQRSKDFFLRLSLGDKRNGEARRHFGCARRLKRESCKSYFSGTSGYVIYSPGTAPGA